MSANTTAKNTTNPKMDIRLIVLDRIPAAGEIITIGGQSGVYIDGSAIPVENIPTIMQNIESLTNDKVHLGRKIVNGEAKYFYYDWTNKSDWTEINTKFSQKSLFAKPLASNYNTVIPKDKLVYEYTNSNDFTYSVNYDTPGNITNVMISDKNKTSIVIKQNDIIYSTQISHDRDNLYTYSKVKEITKSNDDIILKVEDLCILDDTSCETDRTHTLPLKQFYVNLAYDSIVFDYNLAVDGYNKLYKVQNKYEKINKSPLNRNLTEQQLVDLLIKTYEIETKIYDITRQHNPIEKSTELQPTSVESHTIINENDKKEYTF